MTGLPAPPLPSHTGSRRAILLLTRGGVDGCTTGSLMDLLAALRVYSRVVEVGSFSAAAREIGMTQPAISRQIAALEDHFGARLLQRTTRQVTMTDDGRDLLIHAIRLLEAAADAEAAIGRRQNAHAGILRISAPVLFGRLYVAPLMKQLLDQYPSLEVDLILSDARTDLVHDGVDVAVRVGEVTDEGLVARRIGQTTFLTLASAAYLQQHGEPLHPSELAAHEVIIYTPRGARGYDVTFTHDSKETATVRVSGRFRTDSGEAMREAICLGIGIGTASAWSLRDQIVAGTVRPILTDWHFPPRPISAVYPSRRHLAPRTRAVIDLMVEAFRQDEVLRNLA